MIATAHRIRSTDGIDGKDAVGLYLDGIAKTPLLTAEEEVQLAKLIEAGWEPESAALHASLGGFEVAHAVAVSYINAYSRASVAENCSATSAASAGSTPSPKIRPLS